MKSSFALLVSLCALVVGQQFPAQCAEKTEEDQLIAVLKSDHSLQEKDAACARLKRIGTKHSVPALASLLKDDQLSHSARYALESMPVADAGKALLKYLGKTSGSNEVGIIYSLGVRHETGAVSKLSRLLSSSDPAVAIAAAESLGKIGGPKSLKALQAAWRKPAPAVVYVAQRDGLLACANQLLGEGKKEEALNVFNLLFQSEKADGTRLAAFRGMILASGDRGLELIITAIEGSDGPTQGAALQLASKASGPEATRALAALLPKVQPPVQIALLDCLAQRGDPAASPAIAQMIDNPDLNVRLAAITALGGLGDDSVALRLAKKAVSSAGDEKKAARRSLSDLHRGPVTETLLKLVAESAPALQVELLRALGDRGDQSAAPRMLKMAEDASGPTRSALLEALSQVAGSDQVTDLIRLVISGESEDARSEAANTLSLVCQRLESRGGSIDVESLVSAVRSAPLEDRLSLLPVCAGLTDPQVRTALRAALEDSEPHIREGAIRALCDTRDVELLPDLLKVACGGGEEKFRLLAIRGSVQLTTQEDGVKVPAAKKLDALKQILASPLSAEEKRLVLSGLSAINNNRSLEMVVPLLEDADVQSEAAQAVIQIAGSISNKNPKIAGNALKKVLAVSKDPATRKSAEDALNKIKP